MPPQTVIAAAHESAPLPGPGARAWALLLDVDGVLLDIAPRPDMVDIPFGLVQLLHELHTLTGGAMALVSGRPLAVLDGMFGWERFDAAGCHGAEVRAGGRTWRHPARGLPLADIVSSLGGIAAEVPGIRLELKGATVAFHYRNAAISDSEARELVVAAAAPALSRMRLLCGKRVIELLPSGVGKGVAVARLLDRSPYRGRIPVFAGDDVTDDEGFIEVNRAGGFSVAVGPRESAVAAFMLTGPAAVREWLRRVAHALMLTGAP